MGELRLYAISIDQARDMVGAVPQEAERLRAVAREGFRVEPPRPAPRGLLAKLGPLLRHPPDAPVLPHGHPLPSDVDALLAGRYVQPERLRPAWRVVEAWLAHDGRGHLVLPTSRAVFEQTEFELARAGLSSDFALGRLMLGDPRIGLRPVPGMRVGYAKNRQVLATSRALAQVLPQVQPTTRERLEPLADFLASCETWSRPERPDESGRQSAPDLVAVLDESDQPA
ncbi:DUF7691 family protein [Luteococcus peritonei]|uniref:DUF7691 domain-containing protein n=1 Tax=Luteococcus peritonei TaxID=88874 RepID=A0ABW4RYN0_9ACTN